VLAFALAVAGAAANGARAQEEKAPAPNPVRQALAAAFQALEKNDFQAAESGFARAVELDPKIAPAWVGLAEARHQLGQLEAALEAARKAQQVDPELGPAAFAVGRSLAALRRHQEALHALERALELEPESVEALVLSSFVLQELGRVADAREMLEAAWKKNLRDPLVAEQLAIVRLDTGDHAGAAAVAQEAIAGGGDRAALKLALGFALARDPVRKSEAERWLGEALAAGVPQPGPVRLELGALLLDAGRASDALPHLEEAARLLPDAPEPHYKLAQARRAAGDDVGAQAALERFQELERQAQASDRGSKELGIALNEAQTLTNQDRLDEALEKLDRLLAEHPDDSRVNALRAKVLFSMGRTREAENAIARAVAESPQRPEYQYLDGLFHMYAGRFAQAEAALRRALQIDPELAEAHALIAGALVKQRRPEEAIEHFQRALDLGADAPEVRLGYSGALETLGREKEAAEQMEAYRRLSGRQPPQ
jgi:tetratricopeptide (TPR) repeat protein